MSQLASTLSRLLRSGEITEQTLKDWRMAALKKLATNSGQTIGNASGHGISFSAAGRMTWGDWVGLLDIVLLAKERNVKPVSKTTASF